MHGSCGFEGASIVYTPNTDYCGPDEFTYTVADASKVHSDTATVTVNVICPDDEPDTAPGEDVPAPPVANDDFATTKQGASVVLFVLDNDTVPKDVAGSFTSPINGSLDKGSSELVYIPNDGFCGIDTFKYTLTIPVHNLADTGLVTIEVVCDEETPEESPPVPEELEDAGGLRLGDDYATGPMNEPLEVPILLNDIIPEGEYIHNVFLLS